NQDVRARPYKPEISDNIEVGMKSTWLDRRMLFNLTGFFNTYKEQQITVGRTVDGQPTADLINAQKAEIWGVEGELKFVPAERWLVMGSFGWMDGKYKEFTVLDNSIGPPPDFAEVIVERDLSDTKVIRGAPYTFSVSAAYTHPLNGGGDITAQIGWAQRGRTYNTLETVDSSKQKAYGLMDGRITWLLANGSTSVSLWGRNLLDKKYFPSAIDLSTGTAPTQTITKYWGEPLRFGVELRHAFN
ncbi:MAG TPA: TonB-dependent receptor, partial [Pseudomonadales bacterium]